MWEENTYSIVRVLFLGNWEVVVSAQLGSGTHGLPSVSAHWIVELLHSYAIPCAKEHNVWMIKKLKIEQRLGFGVLELNKYMYIY